MDIKTFDEYLNASIDERISFWKDYLSIEDFKFYGFLLEITEDNEVYFGNFFKIKEGKVIFLTNPFDNNSNIKIRHVNNNFLNKIETENIKKGDLLSFELNVSDKKDLKPSNPDKTTPNIFYIPYSENIPFKKENVLTDIEKLFKTKEELLNFKFLFAPEEKEIQTKNEHGVEPDMSNITKVVGHIQNYLANSETPLYYSNDLLYQYIAGLRTNQLVVLGGKPGTGKSSLVEGFAKATNGIVKFIPVQPNWTDKSDLLGFYNPIEKNYVSTPFLEAIFEARKNPEQMYYICLDEMNLSHIEYYFAEFLSKLQNDRKIDLYSASIRKEIEEEILERYYYFQNAQLDGKTLERFLKENDSKTIDDYFLLKKQFRFIEKYPPTITIPENIRFIGTINKDETTKDLSPKVIDRSFIIKIDEDTLSESENVKKKFHQNTKIEPITTPLNIMPKHLTIYDESDEDIDAIVKKAMDTLEKFPIYLTNRFKKAAYQLNNSIKGQVDDSKYNLNKISDILIANLILPKVNFDIHDTDLEKLNNALNELIGEKNQISSKAYKYLVEKIDNGTIESITYWR